MPEEVENLEDDNNEVSGQSNNNAHASSSSPLKNNTSNENNIIDFNKYKSRKKIGNNDNVSNSSTPSNSVNIPRRSMGTNIVNNAKRQIANRALSSVPVLGTLNNLNNIRKSVMARRNASPTTTGGIVSNNRTEGVSDDGITNDVTSNDESVVSNEENESRSLNPLHSIFGSNNRFSSKFKLFGRIPISTKIFVGFLGFLVTFLFIFLIPITVIGFFSGFWGLDMTETSSGGSGNTSYGDYSLSSDGHEILHESLDTFLESKGTSLEEFNNLIASNVQEAGSGTRAGVVAAAVTLISELGNNYGVKIPYFWGGGHGHIATGAEASWGSGRCYTYANGQAYTYCGLDCSGFVTWAINNGGFSIPVQSSNTFVYLDGAERVSLSSSAVLQAGDLLATSGHIILIVGVDDNGYICAEAAGNETGVLFSRKSFDASGYYGIDMSGFYGG